LWRNNAEQDEFVRLTRSFGKDALGRGDR
jgi:hypothetical protein